MARLNRGGSLVLLALALGLALMGGRHALRAPPPELLRALGPRWARHDAPPPAEDPQACMVRPLRMPSGAPAMLSCSEARSVMAQVRARLAVSVRRPSAADFADALAGWLDPHGLWSAAPDAPARAAIRAHADGILSELEERGAGDCEAARSVARIAHAWVEDLRSVYAAARARRERTTRERALKLGSDAVYQDDPVTRPARALAADLGMRSALFETAFGSSVRFAAAAAEQRLFPRLGVEGWTRVILAAALRAYVPLADAHGQWAPMDEEWSLYAADAAVDPGPKLWGRMMRTALGVRVLEDPTPPLREDDLVLSVGGIATAGLSVEQIEQLARLESVGGETLREVVVVRSGANDARTLTVKLPQAPGGDDDDGGAVTVETVSYGDGRALVVSIADVPDGLGDELAEVVTALREGPELPLGILLDLRGNGGGSTDGAAGAIGVFLPGAPSFPMRRQGGGIEVGHALTPSLEGQWRGPVAVLVDGYTASAAEMIAGAIAAYGRGLVVGARTFGKGCVQEYFDDRVGAGVLRLTTMVFSLPSGEPLQGVGLEPSLGLGLPRVREREALLGASPPPWRGPDVRDRTAMGGARWPAHRGRVGPCRDAAVCAALERVQTDAARRRAASVASRATRPSR